MDSPHELRAKAERYRQLASTVTDPRALEALRDLAARYEELAAELEATNASLKSDASQD